MCISCRGSSLAIYFASVIQSSERKWSTIFKASAACSDSPVHSKNKRVQTRAPEGTWPILCHQIAVHSIILASNFLSSILACISRRDTHIQQVSYSLCILWTSQSTSAWRTAIQGPQQMKPKVERLYSFRGTHIWQGNVHNYNPEPHSLSCRNSIVASYWSYKAIWVADALKGSRVSF